MVERRLQILITSWRPDARAASAFFSSEASTNGPFQTERTMVRRSLLLPLVAAYENESVGRLVGARLLALSGLAPWSDRVTTAGGAALAAAVRMVNRVHRHAAIVRPAAEPARTAGLADRDVHVIGV